MKSLFSLIFLFLFANSAFAANLCDTSCNLTITFPSGGSIEVTEALMFTFGTGGVLELGATGTINTAVQPDSTDYSAGGTLVLAAGESITFDAGGSLDLGAGGNLDYIHITITTDGDINIQAVGGIETIYLYSITLSGTANVVLMGANISLLGTVESGADATLNFGSTGSDSGCGTNSAVTLTGSNGAPIVIDTSSTCNTISTSIGTILLDASLTLTDPNAGGVIAVGEFTLDGGELTLDAGESILYDERQSDTGSLNMLFVLLVGFFGILRKFFLHFEVLNRAKQQVTLL